MRKGTTYLGIIALSLIIGGCIVEEVIGAKVPDPLIVPEDFPEMTLKNNDFFSLPENDTLNISGHLSGNAVITTQKGTESLPNESRKAGQNMVWENETGKRIQVGYIKYDSNEGFKDFFDRQLRSCPQRKNNTNMLAESLEIGCDPAGIGEYGIYVSRVLKNDPEMKSVSLQYSRGNYIVKVIVNDKKDVSFEEAVEIAKRIDGRLN